MLRECDVCGELYSYKRSTSRFCSGRCRQRSHRTEDWFTWNRRQNNQGLKPGDPCPHHTRFICDKNREGQWLLRCWDCDSTVPWENHESYRKKMPDAPWHGGKNG